MRIKYLGLAAVLLLPQSSQACSCVHRGDVAGFIHASLKSLPSNARGAIFLAPGALGADAFEITSDLDQGALAVDLSYPQLGREGDSGANASTLLRVGVKGGFKPGATYTIRYTGPVERWAYSSAVTFLVETQPLDTSGRYTLVLDGAPLRQMLPFRTLGGSCSVLEPVAVQDFHYEMPASHQAYADAVMVFSESREEPQAASATGKFAPIVYASSLCERNRFGTTARPAAHDLLPLRCDAKGGRYSVRGWAGLLEVEDRLQATNVAMVDAELAEGSSCTAYGMLKHALHGGGDAERIKHAVCAVGRGYQMQYPKLTPADLPPVAPLLALARSADPEVQHCALGTLSKLMVDAPAEPGDLVPGYAGVLESELLSFDAAKVDRAVDQLSTMLRFAREHVAGSPAALRREALTRALLPAMQQAVVRGTGARILDLARIVVATGPASSPAVPALWAAAEARGESASAAITALTGIIPNEPRFHEMLIRSASDPALRQAAAFAFADTAGRARPDDAVRLLMQLARDGNPYALDRLAKFGRAARASIPMLLEFLVTREHEWERGSAFSALLAVSDEEPEVIAAIHAAIAAPKGRGVPAYKLAELKKFKQRARVFLPALEQLMAQPREMDLSYALEPVIKAMELPPAQHSELLGRMKPL